MEKSASEPILKDEDYHMPCHGVGATGPEPRMLHGPFQKDKGIYSSRINQIIKQAQKVPGPGKYVAHEDWSLNGGSRFAKLERSYKPMNKTPDPGTYERKDLGSGGAYSIGSKDCTSNHPRILYGKMPKGKRRSFLDQAMHAGAQTPDPGHYPIKHHFCDRVDLNVSGSLNWQRESQKTKSIGAKKPDDLAPNHYSPNYIMTEERLAIHSVPKELGKNFLDKAVKEKWVDARTKKEIPGPGTYNVQNFDDSRISRGTRHLQLRNLTKSPISGYL
jgi:hypothetical protein